MKKLFDYSYDHVTLSTRQSKRARVHETNAFYYLRTTWKEKILEVASAKTDLALVTN
jgi:hypothetical protein